MKDRLQDLTQEYLAGKLERREFFRRMIGVLGSYTLVHQYLESSGMAVSLLSPRLAQQLNVTSREIQYPSGEHQITAAFNVPAQTPAPGIIVIHENRGLNEHIRDVARRLAGEGYVTLAPDLLSRKGGTAAAGSPDEARRLIGTVSQEEAISDLLAAHRYLRGTPECRGQKVGCVGFCWGGARSFLLATADPELAAAVVFYGSPPPGERLDQIRCPVLGIYGELDTRITSTVEDTARAMQEKGKSYEYHVYPDAQHAFFNDTNPERYNAQAARDAWERTLAFFRQHLKG